MAPLNLSAFQSIQVMGSGRQVFLATISGNVSTVQTGEMSPQRGSQSLRPLQKPSCPGKAQGKKGSPLLLSSVGGPRQRSRGKVKVMSEGQAGETENGTEVGST